MPLRKNATAVFGFIAAKPGKTLVRKGSPRHQPTSTTTPASTAALPQSSEKILNRIGGIDATDSFSGPSMGIHTPPSATSAECEDGLRGNVSGPATGPGGNSVLVVSPVRL